MKPFDDESVGALIEALFGAATPADVVRAWLVNVRPDVELALLARPGAGDALAAVGGARDGFRPLPVPPLPVESCGTQPERRSPGRRREDALDDLLASLGFGEALVVPLEPGGSVQLILARTARHFSRTESAELATRAAWLAPALRAVVERGLSSQRERSVTRELVAMEEVAQELSPLVGARDAALSAAHALQQQLAPVAGAVLVQSAPDAERLVAAWPAGAAARDTVLERAGVALSEVSFVAADRHAVRGDLPPRLAWIDVPGGASSGFPRARLLLAFAEPEPEAARRVAPKILRALKTALERIAVQRAAVERRLLAAFRGLPLGAVVLASETCRVRFMNDAAAALLDAVSSAPDGERRLTTIGGTEIAPLAAEAVERGMAWAEVLDPKTERIVEMRAYPAPASGDGDEPRDVQIILEDITEERRRAVTMARAERLSAMGVLVSGIVHEINNPLATIHGYAQMIVRDPEAPGRARYASLIEEEAQRCQRIVADMLLLARDGETEARRVAPAALAERAIALLRHPFKISGVEAGLRVSDGLPDLEGDPDALLQVLINLMTNAMQALESQEGPRRVDVDVEKEGDGVRVVVADNGPGIPAEIQSRIFDPFFTTKPEGKGTGFGLSLVASTVERHGGTVEVKSAAGLGTRIEIVLPCSSPAASPGGSSRAAIENALAGVRVLVAEDDLALAEVVREMLETAGARVEVAKDGREALDRALALRPDVIVSDVHMPVLGGAGLLDALREHGSALAERVVFTTGEGSARERAPHGRPCLAKPFDMRALVEAVRHVAAAPPSAPAPRGGGRPAHGAEG